MGAAAQKVERAPRKAKAKPQNVVIQVEQVVPPPRLQDSFGRIGGNLTPADVTSILIEADQGRPARLVDLTHESRQKDGHLQSILQTFELAIQALPWDCVAPAGKNGGKPKLRDKKVAEFCKAALRNCKSFPTLIAHHTGEAQLFGYTYSECKWKVEGIYLVPGEFLPISCRRFAFTQSDGRLVFIEKPGTNSGVDLVESHPAGKFIVSRRRVNGDVPVREGLCRCVVWGALFRNWDIRDWLQLAEMSWKPWRKGKFKKGTATTQDVAALKRILEGMIASGIAIYPDSYEVDVSWPQFSGSQKSSNHRELAEFMARELSKAVLGATDVVEPGENGARAAVETRDGLRETLRNAIAIALAADIKTYIIEPMVRMNFGPVPAIPEFFFLTEDPTDVEKFSRAIKTLRDAGLRIPASYVYEQTGMPEPKENDVLLGDGETTDPNKPSGPNGSKETPEDDEAEGEDAAA